MNIRLIIVTGLAVCAALLAMPRTACGQMFVSINGTGHNGGGSIVQYAPDGTQSPFRSGFDRPRGVVFDSAGNLFVATTTFDNSIGHYEGTIFKITDGLMSTFATGFGTDFFLEGLAVDSADNVFAVASNQNDDNLASTIYKVTPGGTVSRFGLQPDCVQQGTMVNCSVPGNSFGLAFDSVGNLYAPSTLNSTGTDRTIFKFTPGDVVVRSVFVSETDHTADFSLVQGGPSALAFDSSGNLFVSAGLSGEGAIFEFAPDGMQSTIAHGLTTGNDRGLAFDGDGNLFVAEIPVLCTDCAGDILQFTPEGTPPPTWTQTTFAPGIGTTGNSGPEFLAFTAGAVTPVNTAVTLTFPEGTGPETTTVTRNPSPSPVPFPSEFQMGNPPLAFDITANPTPTTAPIIIAFQVPQSFLDQCGCDVRTLRVLHGTNLDDVTAPDPPWPPNPTTRTVYASVSSLSPFVIAKLRYGAQVQQPINAGGTSIFSVRRGVVPVKFTLTQDGTATCVLPGATIALTRTSGGTTGAIDESVYSGSADTGSNFRISSCQYLYNLSASALGVGTYRADIKINGTVVGNAIFQLK